MASLAAEHSEVCRAAVLQRSMAHGACRYTVYAFALQGQKQNTSRRDLLLTIQAASQKQWEDSKIFDAAPPAEGNNAKRLLSLLPTKHDSCCLRQTMQQVVAPAAMITSVLTAAGEACPEGKFFGNFPYPYMNGMLHLGHAFSLSKVRLRLQLCSALQHWCMAQSSPSCRLTDRLWAMCSWSSLLRIIVCAARGFSFLRASTVLACPSRCVGTWCGRNRGELAPSIMPFLIQW